MNRIVPLTKFENVLKYICGTMTIPFTPIGAGLFSVPANTQTIITRFGKIDRIVDSGIRWSPLGNRNINVFIGSQVLNIKEKPLLDLDRTPIIVSATLQYHINDVIKYSVFANSNTDILERELNIALRSICNTYKFESLVSNTSEISNLVKSAFEQKINEYGFSINNFTIIDINWSHEIAKQMLIKNQTQAMLQSRTLIVNAATEIVNSTIKSINISSQEAKDKLITNLLTVLVSNSGTYNTIDLSSK
jgi:regulator of protease activity HflC (stomatin/prohibitin superfamily)